MTGQGAQMGCLRRWLPTWLALLLLVFALASGCDSGSSAADWIEESAQTHEAVDRALADGDTDAARAYLVDSLARPMPDDLAEQDRRAILQDIYFRLANLDLSLARPSDALAWCDSGLELGTTDDLFTANLLVTRGRAMEALGREDEAADNYYNALRINEILLRQSLGNDEREE